MSGELAAERWSPAQRVESVLVSILSLLDDAEVSSPANVDAGVMLRNDPARYKEMVRKDLEISKQDIPAGYVMPSHADAFKTVGSKEDEYLMSWDDSDGEQEDFGGSDSDFGSADEDEDMDGDEDEDEEDDGDAIGRDAEDA